MRAGLRSWRIGAVMVVALVLGGCSRGAHTPGRRGEDVSVHRRQERPPVPAGSLFAARTSFRLAVFHARKGEPVLPGLPGLLAQRYPALRLAGEGTEGESLPRVRVQELTAQDYPLPPDEVLVLAARGLSPQEQATLASSEQVLLLEFTTAPPALEAVRQAHALALELARARGGLLWDEQAAEFFSPERWEARRLGSWEEGTPPLERHFNSLMYPEDEEHAWFVTVGLEKFGLPELEVGHVPESEVERVGTLINLVAQLMLQGSPVGEGGRFPVSLEAVKHAELRERVQRGLGEGARQSLVLGLAIASPGEASGEGRRVELVFPEGPGSSPTEHLHAALVELFGARDELVRVQHDEELEAASRRAVERLISELKPRFLHGLESGERLFVKAPFKTRSGGDEWMWVRVQRWEGPTLHGVLESDPRDVPGLSAGSPVTVEESSLFDYLLMLPDGSSEGNETQELILRGQSWDL